jgi:hypothetical protein
VPLALIDQPFQQDLVNLGNMPSEFNPRTLEVNEEIHLTS